MSIYDDGIMAMRSVSPHGDAISRCIHSTRRHHSRSLLFIQVLKPLLVVKQRLLETLQIRNQVLSTSNKEYFLLVVLDRNDPFFSKLFLSMMELKSLYRKRLGSSVILVEEPMLFLDPDCGPLELFLLERRR